MKNCPKCCVETRSDAEWCWFCGYAFEDEATGAPAPPGDEAAPAGSIPSRRKDFDA